MWTRIEDVMMCRHKLRMIREMSEEQRVDWILGTEFDLGHWKFPALQSAVIRGLKELWAGRGRPGLRDDSVNNSL